MFSVYWRLPTHMTSTLLHHCLYVAAAFVALMICACGSSSSSLPNRRMVSYNVELRTIGPDIIDRCNPTERLRSIQTTRKPDLIPAGELTEPKYRVYALPCGDSKEEVVYDIPASKVLRVTETSDPLMPARLVDSLVPPEGCCRDRTGLWIFDKLEFRAAINYRGSQDSIFYASATGGTTYYSSTFGIGRGGSSFFEGIEIAGMWNANWIDHSHRLQLGFMLGAWPVDGSVFFPVTFHPRYTFIQHPEQYTTSCSSWYLFGDIGMPVDFNTGAPFIADVMEHQRTMIGLGVGHDWSWGCNKDFSIDAGWRRINLPLPQIECCPSVPKKDRYPFRLSDAFYLRLGITY